MVGGLYKKGDNKRDTGFYIFYMGINIGAFLGALTVGAVGKNMAGTMDLDWLVLEWQLVN